MYKSAQKDYARYMKYIQLLEDDPDHAYELLTQWQTEISAGDLLNSENVIELLRDLLQVEDLDAIVEFCEELSEETPSHFISMVLDSTVASDELKNEFASNIRGSRLNLEEPELLKLLNYDEFINEYDSDNYNASKSGISTVAECRTTPINILTTLATSKLWQIRYRVSMNPTSNSQILDLIAKSRDQSDEWEEIIGEDIRASVAANRTTSSETLAFLSTDSSSLVRTIVTANPATRSEDVQKAKELGIDKRPLPTQLSTSILWWDTQGNHWKIEGLN